MLSRANLVNLILEFSPSDPFKSDGMSELMSHHHLIDVDGSDAHCLVGHSLAALALAFSYFIPWSIQWDTMLEVLHRR